MSPGNLLCSNLKCPSDCPPKKSWFVLPFYHKCPMFWVYITPGWTHTYLKPYSTAIGSLMTWQCKILCQNDFNVEIWKKKLSNFRFSQLRGKTQRKHETEKSKDGVRWNVKPFIVYIKMVGDVILIPFLYKRREVKETLEGESWNDSFSVIFTLETL